jgi:hypothetical protein
MVGVRDSHLNFVKYIYKWKYEYIKKKKFKKSYERIYLIILKID